MILRYLWKNTTSIGLMLIMFGHRFQTGTGLSLEQSGWMYCRKLEDLCRRWSVCRMNSLLQVDPSMAAPVLLNPHALHPFMSCILCYDWTLATTLCSPPCHVSPSVFISCFVYMDWRRGHLPPWLLITSCLAYCTWIGGAAPCSLGSLPRPVRYTSYHHIHVSLSVRASGLVYIDSGCCPLPLHSLQGCAASCPLDSLLRRTWPHILEAHGCPDTSQCLRRSRRVYKHLSVSSFSH